MIYIDIYIYIYFATKNCQQFQPMLCQNPEDSTHEDPHFVCINSCHF